MATTTVPRAHDFSSLKLYHIQQKRMDALDLFSPLSKYLKKQYSGGSDAMIKEYSTALAGVQEKRDSLRNLQDKSEASRDLCLRYACELAHIERHFPVNTAAAAAGGESSSSFFSSSSSSRIKLSFSAYDAFTKRKVSQSNIYYEQASALLQAAIFINQLASSQARTSSESITLANKYFKQSAQILHYIQSHVTSVKVAERVTNDLSQESLDFLRDLMLAEAQQCVCENAATKGMSFAVQASLAEGAASMYSGVHSTITGSVLLHQEQLDRNWQGYVHFKSLYFAALAQFLQALHLHEKDEVGEEIGRLEKCLQLIKASTQQPVKVGGSLREAATRLEGAVKVQLSEARYDNEKVYHMRVPSPDSVSAIPAKVLSKLPEDDAIPTIVKESDPGDRFSKLVPVSVLDAVSGLKRQLHSRFESVRQRQKQTRENIRRELAANNLPAALVMFEQSRNPQHTGSAKRTGFPEDVHQKIRDVRQSGNAVERVRDLKLTLDEMSSQTQQSIHNVQNSLVEEEKEDQECCNQFGPRWKRPASSALTGKLKKQLDDYLNKVKMASRSDQLVTGKIDEHEKQWHKIDMSPKDLDATLPVDDTEQDGDKLLSQSPELSASFSVLQTQMKELDELFGKATQMERDIVQKIENPGEASLTAEGKPLQTRMLDSLNHLDSMCEMETKGYDDLFADFEKVGQNAAVAMREVAQANQQFTEALNRVKGNQSAMQQERERHIRAMYESLNKLDEVTSNIREGINFYSTIQDMISSLRQRVEDFCFARKTEKQDLISNLQMMSSGVQEPIQQYQYQYRQQPPQYQYQQQPQQSPQQHLPQYQQRPYNANPQQPQQQQPYYNYDYGQQQLPPPPPRQQQQQRPTVPQYAYSPQGYPNQQQQQQQQQHQQNPNYRR